MRASADTKSLISFVAEAENCCQSFHWEKAAEIYTASLTQFPKYDFAGKGEALERISLCRFRAAMQSKSVAGFSHDVRQAILAEQRARGHFKRIGTAASAHVLRSQAMEAYLAHWLARSPAEKKRLLDRSWRLARKTLRLFETSKNHPEYVHTYNSLSFGLALSVEYDGNLQSRIRKLKQAIQNGNKTVVMASSVGNKQDYAEALVKTSIFLNGLADDYSEQRKSGQNRIEALQLWEKAMSIDRETALRGISHPLSGFYQTQDPSLSLQLCKEALEIVKPRHDHFAIGRLMDQLAKWTHYTVQSSESRDDPTLGPKMRAEALGYAEEAAERYEIINFTSPIAGVLWVHSPYTEHFQELSRCEANPTRRRLLLEKGLHCTGELLTLAKQSENKRVMYYAFHTCTKCEVVLAANERNERRKRALLQKARAHSIQAYRLIRQVDPSTSWNRGVAARAVARVLSKLAELERRPSRQCRLLLDAATRLEEGLEVTTAVVSALQRPGHRTLTAQIAQYNEEYGDTLKQLAPFTEQEEYFRKAARGYSVAVDWYGRISRYDRLAECYWKLADTYDRLQAYSFASEKFILAARAYRQLGRLNPALEQHSQNYRRYLIAWSKIELARDAHARDQYDKAARLYDSAARLQRSTRRWSFLAPYYSARAKFECGENLSRRGLRLAATSAFHRAAILFAESRTKLKEQLPQIDQLDERKMVEELLNAPRVNYCQAREILEEATEAESQEDYRTSYEKLGLASVKLKEVLSLSNSELDRRDISFLSALCEAWRLSCRAEIDNSIELLNEACARFDMARNLSPSQSATKLVLGHAAFCKALVSNRKFTETRNPSFHREASKQLDFASGFYLEAGSKTAAAHAMARKLLIEAFENLDIASKEKNRDERAGVLRMSAALLRESVRMFVRAQQPKKADLARSLLEKSMFESKIASQLTNILAASHGAPANIAFRTQVNGSEKPAGLDRFEGGDLEVRLVDVTMGQLPEKDVELEIEITNIGKQSIQLQSLDGAVPEGAKLIECSEKWTPKGASLAGALRRFGTLQTEKVRIRFRPETEGLLLIRPKLRFVDASGVQLERATETRVFSNSRIMEFLCNSFLADYSSRLATPNCGWRTLMSIVGTLKIPRSHVYGEPRYGRSFGRQLDALVKSSLVEYRIFLGERGRGGEVTKVRANSDNEYVRRYLESAAIGSHSFAPLRPISLNVRKDTSNLDIPGDPDATNPSGSTWRPGC